MEIYVWRAIERLLVVLAGAGSVFLGYRLFLAIPFEKDAEGKITIPHGPEITLSRIGPGAFFALFGCIVLGMSLYMQVSYEMQSGSDPASPVARFSGAREVASAVDLDRQAELQRLRGYLGTVNFLAQRLTSELPTDEAALASLELSELRLGLMRAHWGDDLGDWQAFADWVARTGGKGQPPERLADAASIFRHGQ